MHRAHARYAGPPADDATLLERHAALVERNARRLAARTAGAVAAEDLWSAGALGLLDAARRFDAARDVRFETFAEHRIRGAMLDELRRMDHLPRRLRAQAEAVEGARAKLSQALGRDPSTDEVATALDLTVDDVDSLVGAALPHAPVSDGLPSAELPAEEQLARAQASRAVARAVATLPERLQLVLSLHYVEELTYREIAKILEVSEPRVCQLHAEAMGKLRSALAADA